MIMLMERNNMERNDPQQLHPYQYLTELNAIYSSCNKANAKSYSSVSTLKLAWKPFSIIKIPNCFETTYENQHKNIKQNKCETRELMEDYEKKIWKDHQEILTRYYRDKENKARATRPQTCISRTKKISYADSSSLNQNQSNLLLKRMKEKGVKLESSKDEVKEEVLKKLKKIQNDGEKKKVWRIQSAINPSKKDSKIKIAECKQNKEGELYFVSNESKFFEERKQKIGAVETDQKEYLKFSKNSEILAEYKRKIKEVDCAIDDFNVKKAATLLRNMENIVRNLE